MVLRGDIAEGVLEGQPTEKHGRTEAQKGVTGDGDGDENERGFGGGKRVQLAGADVCDGGGKADSGRWAAVGWGLRGGWVRGDGGSRGEDKRGWDLMGPGVWGGERRVEGGGRTAGGRTGTEMRRGRSGQATGPAAPSIASTTSYPFPFRSAVMPPRPWRLEPPRRHAGAAEVGGTAERWPHRQCPAARGQPEIGLLRGCVARRGCLGGCVRKVGSRRRR